MTSLRSKCRTVVTELVRNPFVPILFLGKAIELWFFYLLPNDPFVRAVWFTVFAFTTLIGWLYLSDDLAGALLDK